MRQDDRDVARGLSKRLSETDDAGASVEDDDLTRRFVVDLQAGVLQPWPMADGIAQGTEPRTPQKRMCIDVTADYFCGNSVTTV